MKYQVHCPSLSEFEASLEGVARPVVLEGSREVREEDRGLLARWRLLTAAEWCGG